MHKDGCMCVCLCVCVCVFLYQIIHTEFFCSSAKFFVLNLYVSSTNGREHAMDDEQHVEVDSLVKMAETFGYCLRTIGLRIT